LAYNKEHGITPKTVQTAIKNSIEEEIEAHKMAQEAATGSSAASDEYITVEFIQNLYDEMLEAAKQLDFERAQLLRDQIVKLESELKKKHGNAAPASVLGDKNVQVSLPLPKGRKRWQKREG